MECNYCSIQSSNTILCRICSLAFCSTSCVINHFSSNHSDNIQGLTPFKLFHNLKYQKIETLTTLTPFIKPGKYLSEVVYNPAYSYDQLSPITYNGIPFLLGSGSFGEVYLAEHKLSHIKVAIKKMNKKHIEYGLGTIDVIRNEINIHSRLVHDHIIKLLNYTEDSPTISMIIEFASKGNLYTRMKKTKGMSEDKAFKYFIQTTSAIHFLHQINFIHRDVKPENLLLDDNDNIKLADFGWCNEITPMKRSTFCGTVEYMAPEIVNNEKYDSAVDTWSLGILLYELIHGYSPFRGKDMSQVMKNIKEHKLVIHKNISKECKDIICKLLSVNPQERLKVNEIFTHPFVVKYTPESINANIRLPNSNSAIYEKTLPSKVRRLDSSEKKKFYTNKKSHNALNQFNNKNSKVQQARNLLLDFEKEGKNNKGVNEYSITQVESYSKKEKAKSSSVTKTGISIEKFLSITSSPEKPKHKLIKKVNMVIHKKKNPLIGGNIDTHTMTNSNSKENKSINSNCSTSTTALSTNRTNNYNETNKKETYPDPSQLKMFFSKMLGV